MRRALVVGAVAIAVVASSSCGIGAKEALSRQLTRATLLALRSGTATATMNVAVVPIAPKGVAVPGPPRIPAAQVQGVTAVMDFGTSRAAVGGTAGHPETATLLFDKFLILQRRPSSTRLAGAAALLGPPTNLTLLNPAGAPLPTDTATATRRPWVRFDYSSLPRKGGDRIAGNLGITPSLVLVMLAGALSGSVHRTQHRDLNGVDTTYFKFNVGRDRAVRGFPEKARDTVSRMFRANAISGIVYHAQAWIGSDGRPRRIVVQFPQKLNNRDRATLTVTLDLTGYGAPVQIALPPTKDVASVTGLGAVVRSST